MQIPNLAKINYQIESGIEELTERAAEPDLQNQYLIKFQVQDPELQLQQPQVFSKINLDRVRVTRQTVQNRQKELFGLYCSVDVIDDRKLLTIASAIAFLNTTDSPLQLQIANVQNS
jgi:hypothetical protein